MVALPPPAPASPGGAAHRHGESQAAVYWFMSRICSTERPHAACDGTYSAVVGLSCFSMQVWHHGRLLLPCQEPQAVVCPVQSACCIACAWKCIT